MENIELLEKLGLEEKEAKVYLALLSLGSTTATKVSAETKIERTLMYKVLDKLMERGLVSYVIQNNVKYFSATDPQRLLTDLKEKEKELKKALPTIIKLRQVQKEETKGEIYKGKEGLKTILNDIIKTGKDYVVFGEERRFQVVLPIASERFMRQIERAKIKEKVLVKEGLTGLVKSKYSSFRYVPKEYSSPSTTLVYGDKVAVFVWSPPYLAFVIENKEIADSYRAYFDMLWKLAKK